MSKFCRICQVLFFIGGFLSLFKIIHNSSPAMTVACIAFSEVMSIKADMLTNNKEGKYNE